MQNLFDRPSINAFYMRSLGIDSQQANRLVQAHQTMFHNEPHRAPIFYDDKTKAWHGRMIKSLREKLGMERKGAKGGTYRNRLKALGNESYFRPDLISAIKRIYDCDNGRAESIFDIVKAKRRNILIHHDATNTWRFQTAPAPDPLKFGPEKGISKHAHYLRLYGSMPGLLHRPGKDYDASASEVLRYILAQSGNTDFRWAEAEYDRARVSKAIRYDAQTGKTFGALVARHDLAAVESGSKKSAELKPKEMAIKDSVELREKIWNFNKTHHLHPGSNSEIEKT